MFSATQNNNFKAIGFGAISFFALYLLILYFSDSDIFSIYNSNNLFWLNFVGFSMFIVCGYLTASISKEDGVLNSIILGLLTPILVILGMFILDGPTAMLQALNNNWYKWGIAGFVLCGSGGVAWYLKTKFSHGNP